MYVPFLITVSTTPTQLNVTAEGDIKSPGMPTFALTYGQTIEFDVPSGNDVFVGPDNQVTTIGNPYSAGGKRGRKYLAGTHVEITLYKGEDLYIVQASGTSTIEGSQVGV